MRWVATAGVSTRIVRNLGILNILLLIPTLSDLYNTEPFEVIFTKNAIINIGKKKTIKNIEARTISNIRFILPDYSFSDYFFSVVPVPHKSGSISCLHINSTAFFIPLCSFFETMFHCIRRFPSQFFPDLGTINYK